MWANMQWSLNVFQRRTLLTSDHPVMLLPPTEDDPHFGVGIATAAGYGAPLSRHLGLVINASPNLPDMRVPGTTAIAKSPRRRGHRLRPACGVPPP